MLPRNLGFRCDWGEGVDCVFDAESGFYAEDAATATLKGIEVRSRAEGLTKVACKCTNIGSLAACHADHGAWQSQSRIIRHIDSVGSASFFGYCWFENRAIPLAAWGGTRDGVVGGIGAKLRSRQR